MKASHLTTCTLAVLLALLCRADTNGIDQAVLAFPKISAWEFRPDEAVRSANALIAAGREAACTALRRVGNAKWNFPDDYEVDQKVCHLCRLVFLPRAEGGLLRAPRLGAPELLPLYSMRDAVWPFMPFAIVQDVPLSMTLGYSLHGVPERADDYITYCLSNGTFRTQLFPMPSATTASNALHEVLASPAWKALKWEDSGVGWSYTLSEDYARETLWAQVKNMASDHPKPPSPDVTLGVVELTNHTPSQRMYLGSGENVVLTPTLLNQDELQLEVAYDRREPTGEQRHLAQKTVRTRPGQVTTVAFGFITLTVTPVIKKH